MILSRRQALARIAAVTGSVMVGAEFFVSGYARTDKTTVGDFTSDELALMDEIAETIIPATDTPGAKAAGVGATMAILVNDCYDDGSHAAFRIGLRKVDEASRGRFGKSFVAASPDERTALLNDLDAERRAYVPLPPDGPPHYFRMLKELTLLGYFTSEIGCTQALRYVETPGAFHGDVPYKKGDRAWANPRTA